MSRSYKKHEVYTDGRNGQVVSKRFANKAVRRYKNYLSNGKAYKKLYCSWEIHDHIWRWTWKDAKEEWEREDSIYHQLYATLSDFYRYWRKYWKNK